MNPKSKTDNDSNNSYSGDLEEGEEGEKVIAKYLQNKKGGAKSDNDIATKKKDKKSSTTPVASATGGNNIQVPKFSYEELNMPTPKEFDYESYKQDWCRYCGARFSSNFTKGPWGSRTLCTVHYIKWMQKKTLSLSSYKELPKKPINPDDLNELLYITREKAKNPDFNPGELLNKMVIESFVEDENEKIEEEEVMKREIEEAENKNTNDSKKK